MDYRLHYAPDNASLIVRLALEELGQGYRTILVDRAAQAQRSPAYLALNPAGRIPVLETPQGPIFETGAILLWLAERHADLCPLAGQAARGDALSWLFYIANTPHALMALLFYAERYAPESAVPDMQAVLAQRVREAFDLLEASHSGAPYFRGDRPGVWDCYLVGLLRWSRLYPTTLPNWNDLDRTPKLAATCRAFEQRRSAQRVAKAEGLGPFPFSDPVYASPSEGSAT